MSESGKTSNPLILGCMGLGGPWEAEGFGEAELARADGAVRAALDSGIDSFDHADIYSRGKSEAVFGALLARDPGLRGRIFLQTKCGIRPAGSSSWKGWTSSPKLKSTAPKSTAMPRDPDRYDFSRAWIMAAAEASLARLRTDRLDRLILHRPDPLMEVDEVLEAFTRLHEAGKVRGFGVSNFPASALSLMATELEEAGFGIQCDQVELSLLHHDLVEATLMAGQRPWAPSPWRGEFDSAGSGASPLGAGSIDLVPFCLEAGIELQAWGALAQGRLSGLPLPAEAPQALAGTAALVAELAAERGVGPEAVVLAWLLRLPWAFRPVIGTTDPARIASAAAAATVRLSREEWYALYEAARGAPIP